MPQSGGIGLRRERVKVEDACKDLSREGGDGNEHVAAREDGEAKTLRSIDVLVDWRGLRRAPWGFGLDCEMKLVQLALEAG